EGEPGRMSTATSKMRPRAARTSLACPGARWKCSPRTVFFTEREWLSWTNVASIPALAIASPRQDSMKKPRSSRKTRGFTSLSPARGRSTISIGSAPGAQETEDVLAVARLAQGRPQLLELPVVDVAHAPRHLFDAA